MASCVNYRRTALGLVVYYACRQGGGEDMNDDLKDLLLTVFGVMLAKVVDVMWDKAERRLKEKAPDRPDEEGEEP